VRLLAQASRQLEADCVVKLVRSHGSFDALQQLVDDSLLARERHGDRLPALHAARRLVRRRLFDLRSAVVATKRRHGLWGL
jgi:hypothetical protein